MRKIEAHYRDSEWHAQLSSCPLEYRKWLCDRGSLTLRIQSRCDAFRVSVISQGLANASKDELKAVGLRPRELGIVREVGLYCADVPVVFAHSVLTTRGLRKSWNLVSGLGNRSLGAALFADPRIKRLPLRYKNLNASDKLFHRACKHLHPKPLQLWARRSIFLLRDEPLLVTEIFLPGITKLQK